MTKQINKTEQWFLTHWRLHPEVVRDGHQPPIFYFEKRKVNAIRKLAERGIVTVEENMPWPQGSDIVGVGENGVILFTINRDAYREFQNARLKPMFPETPMMWISDRWPEGQGPGGNRP